MVPQTRDRADRLKPILSRVLLLFAFLIVVFTAARINWFKGVHDTFLTWVMGNLGLDFFAAEAVAVLLTASTIAVIPSFVLFFLFGRRRKEAGLAAIALTTLGAVSVYTVGINTCFDRNTGTANRYYIITASGPKFSSRPDFDPQFGEEYVPYTKEVAQQFDGDCAIYRIRRSVRSATPAFPESSPMSVNNTRIDNRKSEISANYGRRADVERVAPRLDQLNIDVRGIEEELSSVLEAAFSEELIRIRSHSVRVASGKSIVIRGHIVDAGPLLGGVASAKAAFTWSIQTQHGNIKLRGGESDISLTGVTLTDAQRAVAAKAGRRIARALSIAVRNEYTTTTR
jgi:hypothetical protein